MEKLDLGTFRGLGSLELEEMSRQADYSGELHRRLSDVGLFDPQKVPQNAAPQGPPLLNRPLTNGYLLPPYTPPDEPLTWAFGVVEEPLQPLPEHFSFMSPDELYNQKPNPVTPEWRDYHNKRNPLAKNPLEKKPKEKFNPDSERQAAQADLQLEDKLAKIAEMEAREAARRRQIADANMSIQSGMRGLAESLGGFKPSLQADYLLTGGPPAPTGFVAEDLRRSEANALDSQRGLDLSQKLRSIGFDVPDMPESQLMEIFPTLVQHQMNADRVYADLMRSQALGSQGSEMTDVMVKEMANLDSSIDNLDDILLKKDDFWTGPIDHGLFSVAKGLGLTDYYSNGPARSAFQSRVEYAIMELTKAMQGSRASNLDLQTIQKLMPSMFDNDITFKAKLMGIQEVAKNHRDKQRRYLAAGGKSLPEQEVYLEVWDGQNSTTIRLPQSAAEAAKKRYEDAGYEVTMEASKIQQ